jgi:hypothetical protein
MCGRRVESGAGDPWRPFCSERCRLLDLGEWLNGTRAIPAGDPVPETGAEAPDDSAVRH